MRTTLTVTLGNETASWARENHVPFSQTLDLALATMRKNGFFSVQEMMKEAERAEIALIRMQLALADWLEHEKNEKTRENILRVQNSGD